MRNGIVGVLIGLSVAGAVFGTLASQTRPMDSNNTPGLPTAASQTVLKELDDHLTSVQMQASKEPLRFPLIRFDEPTLAQPVHADKIIPAGFTLSGSQMIELAPQPRRQIRNGRVPLLEPTDLF